MTKINTTRVLANLANEIRALEQKNALNERDTIKNIIGIGKRLHDASEIPGTHGEYMDCHGGASAIAAVQRHHETILRPILPLD